MGRLLFLILLIALIVYFVKRYLGQKKQAKKQVPIMHNSSLSI
ncbi:MAG: hypothetical protein RLZZ434_780 [Pseudomonadota bacterium]|jgi:flagellar biogenesis protein FliO